MIVDFHTHTTASDGVLSPETLLERAVLLKLDQLAITDHDTLNGWRLVKNKFGESLSSLKLRTGIELTCQWQGNPIHIVGIDVCPENSSLHNLEKQLFQSRFDRAKKISSRLEKKGIVNSFPGVLKLAGEAPLSRPHFAKWMVAEGYVKNEHEAFKSFLGQDKMGDVNPSWPSLETIIGVISDAEGLSVLAHPLKYRFSRAKMIRLVEFFSDCGGDAIEVISGRQTSEQVSRLKRIASDFSLLSSVGSDFHRESRHSAGLGINVVQHRFELNIWSN